MNQVVASRNSGAIGACVSCTWQMASNVVFNTRTSAIPFRARTPILCWSLHTLFNVHHPLSIHLNFSSFAPPQVCGHLVDNCDGFLPWLERKAGSRISSSLSIGKSSYGRSLFASKIIQTGDCILKVPYSVQITADNLPPEITSLISEEVGHIAKLAIVLLIEQKLGQGSEWNPYISCLPQQGELHNTIFWNESELEMIHQCSVYQETINQKSQIEKDFLAIRPALECFRQSFGLFTYKDFVHACELDFLNHDGVSEAIVMSDDDKQCSEVIADRDYAPGEQVQIQFDTPKHDPLHDMKLELLQRYFVPPTEDVKGLKHSVNSFTINIWLSDGAMIT